MIILTIRARSVLLLLLPRSRSSRASCGIASWPPSHLRLPLPVLVKQRLIGWPKPTTSRVASEARCAQRRCLSPLGACRIPFEIFPPSSGACPDRAPPRAAWLPAAPVGGGGTRGGPPAPRVQRGRRRGGVQRPCEFPIRSACDRARDLQVGARSGPEAVPVHSPSQQARPTRQMGISGPGASHHGCCRFICYSPVVAVACGLLFGRRNPEHKHRRPRF
jgi:hypothetical protein